MTTQSDRERLTERVVEAARKWHEAYLGEQDVAERNARFVLHDVLLSLDALPPPIAAPVPTGEDGFTDAQHKTLNAGWHKVRDVLKEETHALRQRIAALESAPPAALTEEQRAAVKVEAILAATELVVDDHEILQDFNKRLEALESKPAPAAPKIAWDKGEARQEAWERTPIGSTTREHFVAGFDAGWDARVREDQAAPTPKETGEGMTFEERWMRSHSYPISDCTARDFEKEWMTKDRFLREAREIASAARERAIRECQSVPAYINCRDRSEGFIEGVLAAQAEKTRAIGRLLSQPPAAQGGGA